MQPPTLRELLEALANDRACTRGAQTIGLPKCTFTFATEESLKRISATEGASKWYIAATLRRYIPHLCHDSLLAGHRGERGVYETMLKHFYLPYIGNDDQNTVAKFMSTLGIDGCIKSGGDHDYSLRRTFWSFLLLTYWARTEDRRWE